VHPRSALFPAGVLTCIFTEPGAEITSVVNFTFNCVLLTTVAASGVLLTMTCDAETKLLPFTVTVVPDCIWLKLTVLGDSDPITGAGRALPHSGLRVLLQPESNNRESRQRKGSVQIRKGMEHSSSVGFPGLICCDGAARNLQAGVVRICSHRGSPRANCYFPCLAFMTFVLSSLK
jgi:hypothetical protein